MAKSKEDFDPGKGVESHNLTFSGMHQRNPKEKRKAFFSIAFISENSLSLDKVLSDRGGEPLLSNQARNRGRPTSSH